MYCASFSLYALHLCISVRASPLCMSTNPCLSFTISESETGNPKFCGAVGMNAGLKAQVPRCLDVGIRLGLLRYNIGHSLYFSRFSCANIGLNG